MTSSPDSTYRAACKVYLAWVRKRPGMYFRSLVELEAFLHGHAMAFGQLELLRGEQTFGDAFANWLHDTTGASMSAGWAYAIEDLAISRSCDETALLLELIAGFLETWGADPDRP